MLIIILGQSLLGTENSVVSTVLISVICFHMLFIHGYTHVVCIAKKLQTSSTNKFIVYQVQKIISVELPWVNLSVQHVYLWLFKVSSCITYFSDLSNLSFDLFYLKAFQCTKLWYAQIVVQFLSKKVRLWWLTSIICQWLMCDYRARYCC